MSHDGQDLGWLLSTQIKLVRAGRRPEFRIAILICTLWLMFVQVYEPWRYGGYNPKSVLETPGFFFWRIGFNISHDRTIAVVTGLFSILLLVYMCGWVLRGFHSRLVQPTAATAPSAPRFAISPLHGRWHIQAPVFRRLRGWLISISIGMLLSAMAAWLVLAALQGSWHSVRPNGDTPLPTEPQKTLTDAFHQLPVPAQHVVPPPAETRPDALDRLLDSFKSDRENQRRSPPDVGRTGRPIAIKPTRAPTQVRDANGGDIFDQLAAEAGTTARSTTLPTGTWITPPMATAGNSVLNIQNGTEFDSAVKLVTASTPRKTAWIVYIRAGDEQTVQRIAPGEYLLRFALGQQWNPNTRNFLKRPHFYQAGASLVFTETEPKGQDPGKYTELHLTLNKVLGGNLPRDDITEAVFEETH